MVGRFFNGRVGSSLGAQFEEEALSQLVNCGYQYFMSVPKPGQSAGVKFANSVEVDGIVMGDATAWAKLCSMLVPNVPRYNPPEVGTHQLVVEVKLCASTLVSALADHHNKFLTTDVDYLTPRGPDQQPLFVHRVVLVDGHNESKRWITNPNSHNATERQAWSELERANVSIFYVPYLSVEWVRDVNSTLTVLEQRTAMLTQAFAEEKQQNSREIAELNATIEAMQEQIRQMQQMQLSQQHGADSEL